MVDTVKCQEMEDLTEDFFRKLLLGAIDRREDSMAQNAHRTASQTPHNSPPPSHALQHRPHSTETTNHAHFSDDDDTVVGGSSRYNTFSAHPALETLHEVQKGDALIPHHPTRMSTLPHRPVASSSSTYRPRYSPPTQHVQQLPPEQPSVDADLGQPSLPRSYTSSTTRSTKRFSFFRSREQ